MMTSKQVVKDTMKFRNPERLAIDLPKEYGSDVAYLNMKINPDRRPAKGVDEWGAVWDNIGISILGEVKDYPLKTWSDFHKLKIPNILEENRWEGTKELFSSYTDKFIMAHGISIYERVHFIRGLENTWIDIYENPKELCELIDILTDMNVYMIKRYASYGADALITSDDWGLQNSLMISPDKWREIWKPRYRKIYQTAHENGLLTVLHSCGDIRLILDDLVDIGLDCIQMDQQENMGLDYLDQL